MLTLMSRSFLAGLAVVEQQSRQLVEQLGEDIGDRMIVGPASAGASENRACHARVGDRRHFGGDQATHRMADPRSVS